MCREIRPNPANAGMAVVADSAVTPPRSKRRGKVALRLRRHRVEEIGLQGGRVSVWRERISPIHTNKRLL